jgi:hypothetical protein
MKNFGIALIAGILALSGGCADDQYNEDEAIGKATIDIEGASREALVGDTVTFIARSEDTYGRDAAIKWTSTGGDVDTEQDGRIARVKFNEPGTYSVRATLEVDGHPIKSDIVEVRVKAVQ